MPVLLVLLSLALGACAGLRPPAAPPATPERLAQEGYHPMTSGGRTLYCREEMMTGSAFTSRNCLTSEQLEERQRRAREVIDTRDRAAGYRCEGKCP